MKKKLTLHRETVKNLNPDAVTVAGAGPNESEVCSFTVCQGCVTKYLAECHPRVTAYISCAC